MVYDLLDRGALQSQVAEVIKGVVTREKAYQHLRNITSKPAKRLAAHKLADLNGDKTVAAILDFAEKVIVHRFSSAALTASLTDHACWHQGCDGPLTKRNCSPVVSNSTCRHHLLPLHR